MNNDKLPNKFSSILIGSESHLIHCADILMQRGHQINGIISSETLIEEWAKEKGIPCIKPGEYLFSDISQGAFDYLFSITNMDIIPSEILALPRKDAINFHDGPLPRYAGLNATCWALINQESTHGITWHIMNADLNKSAILKQLSFD